MSTRKLFLITASTVVGLNILSKLGAFCRDILLSQFFGAGVETDAYFIANAIPGLVFLGVFSTINAVFLPLYAKSRAKNRKLALSSIYTATRLYVGMAFVIGVMTIVLAYPLVKLAAPEAPEETLRLASQLLQVLAVAFVFSSWTGLQNAILQANKQFIWPMVVPVINHAIVIAGLILVSVFEKSIIWVAVAAVCGWALQYPILTFPTWKYKRGSSKTKFSNDIRNTLLRLSIPVFLCISLDQINSVIDLYLGSDFGNGAISHLSYASRLMLMFSGVFSLPVAYFVFPYLADAVARNDSAKVTSLLAKGIGGVLLTTTPLMVTCYWANEEIVAMVYQRGAFESEDVAACSNALKYYSIGIVFIAIREVSNRLFLSKELMKTMLLIGLISATFNLIASVILSRVLGLSGIALGTSMSAVIYVVLQVVVIRRLHREFLSIEIFLAFCLAILSACTMSLAIVASRAHVQSFETTSQLVIQLGLGIFAYCVTLMSGVSAYAIASGRESLKLKLFRKQK